MLYVVHLNSAGSVDPRGYGVMKEKMGKRRPTDFGMLLFNKILNDIGLEYIESR